LSFVSVHPEAFGVAAQDLTGIGSAIRSANTAAAASTTQVAAAAQDEVSAAIAGVFGSVGQQYQTLIGQAEQFHSRFVQALTSSAGAYATTEAANASRLQTFLGGQVAALGGRLAAGYANEQMALVAYENDPTQANLVALQVAITEYTHTHTQELQTYQQVLTGLAHLIRVLLGADG
jgi:hypothetical protein